MFWWVLIIKVRNFYKRKYAYNIYRIKSRGKYSNPHLNLNT
jgi:hypothetical protein